MTIWVWCFVIGLCISGDNYNTMKEVGHFMDAFHQTKRLLVPEPVARRLKLLPLVLIMASVTDSKGGAIIHTEHTNTRFLA